MADRKRGQYDEEYLAYLRDLLASMKDYGLACYVVSENSAGVPDVQFMLGYASRCLVEVLRRGLCAPPKRRITLTRQSGAPGWTLTKAGFDLSDNGDKLVKSGAAFLDGIKGGRLEGERGLWPTGMSMNGMSFDSPGYQKLAAASMK